MKKTLRVAVLSTALALCAAPVFAGGDPGGNDPPPPNNSVSTTAIILTVLSSMVG